MKRGAKKPAVATELRKTVAAATAELNRIEAVFRQVKYHRMPKRSHPTLAGLRSAVETAFRNHRNSLTGKRDTELRPCA